MHKTLKIFTEKTNRYIYLNTENLDVKNYNKPNRQKKKKNTV